MEHVASVVVEHGHMEHHQGQAYNLVAPVLVDHIPVAVDNLVDHILAAVGIPVVAGIHLVADSPDTIVCTDLSRREN